MTIFLNYFALLGVLILVFSMAGMMLNLKNRHPHGLFGLKRTRPVALRTYRSGPVGKAWATEPTNLYKEPQGHAIYIIDMTKPVYFTGRVKGGWSEINEGWVITRKFSLNETANVNESRIVRERSMETIAQVKDDYLRLCEDIAYVIENNALFNSTVKETATFNALFAVDTSTLEDAALDRHAADLLSAFTNAKAHAQEIGASALGSPSAVQRTAKLARKATSAGVTQHERDALMAKVMAACETMRVVLPLKTRSVLEQRIAPTLTP